jgi:hypothetical protein
MPNRLTHCRKHLTFKSSQHLLLGTTNGVSCPPVALVVVEPAADTPATAEVPRNRVMYRHLDLWLEILSTVAAETHIKKKCLSSIIHIAAAAGT